MSEHQSTPPGATRPASGGAPEQPRSDAFFDSVRRLGVTRADERWIGGVAAGLARRWDIDPLLIRGALVVLTIFGGLGLLLYGLAWALLPEERDGRIHAQEAVQGRVDAALAGALIMVVIGLARPTLWWSSTWWFGGWGSLLMVAALAGVLLAGYMIGRRNSQDEIPVSPAPRTEAPTATGPDATFVAGQASAPDTSPTPPAVPSTELAQTDRPTPEPTSPAGSTPDSSLPEPSTGPRGAAAGSALVRPMPADAALAPKIPAGPETPADPDAMTDPDGSSDPETPADPEGPADPDATTDLPTDLETPTDPDAPVDNDQPIGAAAPTEAIDTAAPTEKLPGGAASSAQAPSPPEGDAVRAESHEQTRAEQTFGGKPGDLPTSAVPRSTAAAPEDDTTATSVRPVTTKPSPRPRTPGPGSTTVRIVVGIALLAAAALLLVGRFSGLDAALWLLAGGAVLAVLGLGMVVTGLRGRRAGWLGAWSFLTAILVVPIALTLSVAPQVRDAVSLNPSMMGDSHWSPGSAAELAGGHVHTAGSMVVSLRDLPAGTTVEEPARISLAAGVLVVNVPAGMDVAIEVQGTGALRVISPEPWYREGSQMRTPYDQALVATTTNLRPTAGSGPADIDLVVGVGAGDVIIREVRPAPDDEPGSTNETDADAGDHDSTDAGEGDTTTGTEANDPDADTTDEE